MSVDTHVARSAGETFMLSVWDVFIRLGIFNGNRNQKKYV